MDLAADIEVNPAICTISGSCSFWPLPLKRHVQLKFYRKSGSYSFARSLAGVWLELKLGRHTGRFHVASVSTSRRGVDRQCDLSS